MKNLPMKQILSSLTLSLVLIAMIPSCSKKGMNEEFEKITLKKGSIEKLILTTGTVQPENRLEIKPPIAGRIDKILSDEGQMVRKGQVLALMSSTERAALIDSARSKGEEEVKKWEELYKPTPILAPLSGTIILRKVEVGQTIASNEVVFAMSNRLTVKAQVDETDLANVKINQRARIVLDAFPDQTFEGKVDQIAYEAKTVNNITTYTINVSPNPIPTFMRSGMTANVSFVLESKNDLLTVPNSAIELLDGKSVIRIEQESGKFTMIPIETGITDGRTTEIISNVEKSDSIKEGTIVLAKKIRFSNDKDSSLFGFGGPSRQRGNTGSSSGSRSSGTPRSNR